jgi:hypothetical protein
MNEGLWMKKKLWSVALAVGTLAVMDFAIAGPRVRVEDETRKALTATASADPVCTNSVTAITFPAQQAKVVRMVIRSTHGGAACLDELELFAPGGQENLALASRGAVARASSVISGYAVHSIAHLNDGKFGNEHSWIPTTTNEEWAEIELPQATLIARVAFSRDRTGKLADRLPRDIEIKVSMDGKSWTTVSKASCVNNKKPSSLTLPASVLTEPTWKGVVEYAFQCERNTWGRMNAKDELSPLLKDRPAVPGGVPYWGRIAQLSAIERVLVQFEEMIARLATQGVAVTKEQGELAALRARAKTEGTSDALYLAARYAKRQLFFRDPRLAPVERVLFAKQNPLEPSHNYSDIMDSHFVSGGGLYVLHVPRDAEGRLAPASAEVEMLFDGSAGIVRHPVSDVDGQTLFFAYRPEKPEVDGWQTYWHLWTMRADGSGAHKLTKGPFNDFDPVPLPDGKLGFISTRCVSRFLCWQPQAYVLYRMNRDGTNMKRLSHANLSEWDPTMTRDGRILWTRSEYLDKGADFGHTLWSIRPDGTHPELVFGNDTPYCYGHAREVPDSQELVCTLISHGDHQGPIALIDRSKGLYETGAITSITPDTQPQYQMGRSHQETFRYPEPISRDHFLVSHSPGPRSHWGLYIIDRYGNRELLYLDPAISSKKPSLLRTRVRPPVLQDVTDAKLAVQGLGQFTVQDVYEGLGSSVARGRAKYLQVSHEVPPMLEKLACGEYRSTHPPFTDFYATPVHKVKGPAHEIVTRTQNALGAHAFRQGSALASSNGLITVTERAGWPSYVAKAVIGTVPISEDGSVNFTAPAGKVLYFQLLDENYNELQRMRSVVQLQPGERRSCVGCHDDRLQLPTMKQTTQALVQPVRALDPPSWGSQPFGYERVVQPVLNKRCISCHDGSKKEHLDLRSNLDADLVPTSYRSLVSGGWVHYFDWMYGARPFKAEPLTFGTLRSRLFEALEKKQHRDIKLSTNEMRALKVWVDLNCPLWPDYIYRPERRAVQPQNSGTCKPN